MAAGPSVQGHGAGEVRRRRQRRRRAEQACQGWGPPMQGARGAPQPSRAAIVPRKLWVKSREAVRGLAARALQQEGSRSTGDCTGAVLWLMCRRR